MGGNDAIGTQEKPFTVRLTGDLLDARANDEINLKKIGADNFRIGAMYSPKNIRIADDGNGIIERSLRTEEIAAAYLNTPGEITLTGSAGTADKQILILPHETTILNLKGDTFYIKGVNDESKSIKNGAINLNDISGKLDITSEGSIKQTKDGTNSLTDIKVAANGDVILDGNNKLGAINIGAIGGNFELKNDSDKLTANFGNELTGNVGITQRGDIELTGAVSGSALSLASEKGNIISTGGLKATKEIKLSSATFTHKGKIHTEKLTIETDNGVTINNTENTFSELEIGSRDGKAINGSVEVTIKADKFAPTIKNDVTGDVTLTNTNTDGSLSFGDGETIKIGGTFTADTKGDFDYGATILAGKDINIVAKNIYRREGTTGYFSSPGKILFNVNADNKIGTAENPVMIANSAAKSSEGMTIYGETHIKGVNDGVLTLGNVMTSKDVSISSEGSIVQADGKSIGVDKLSIAAAKEIVLDGENNIINTLALNTLNDTKNSGGVKVNVLSPDGLTVEGNFKTADDVTITAYRSLALNGSLESDKNINLTAGYNNKQKAGSKDITGSSSGVLKAGGNITLKAENVKLSGKVETVLEDTDIMPEDIATAIETMPGIEVTTNKGLDMQNSENKIYKVAVKSDGEKIGGSVLVTSNSEGFWARITNDVENDITLTNTKSDGIILSSGALNGTLKSLKGSITLDTGGGFVTGRALWASKDINITSRNSAILVLNLNSDENNETLKANKNVNLNTAGAIAIEGQITAGSDIAANSGKSGIDIFGTANLTAGNDIKLTVGEGDIAINGSVTANKGNVEMTVDKGNLNIENKLQAKNGTVNKETKAIEKGEVNIKIGEGDIQIGNDKTAANNTTVVTAKGDVNITTGRGIITISGNTKSTAGSIHIKPTEDQTKSNSSANVIISENVVESSETDNEPNDIIINAELEANHSVYVVTREGDIDVTKKITVTNGDIVIMTSDGDIRIYDNGSEDMLSAQNDLDIKTESGAVTVSGKISTTDGDISITSNHDKYTAGQKGITIEESGAINPGRDIYLNTTNGDIEFKKISAENAEIKTINGDVTANTIKADETIHIELERGDLYLNLAESKGVAILVDDSSKSSVKTIKSDTVTVDRNFVTVGKIIPYKGVSTPINNSSTSASSSRSSFGFNYGLSSSYSNNFASNPNSPATLGSTFMRSSSSYLQSTTSAAAPSYTFGEFSSLSDDMGYRLGRNYFEVKFVPTWLEKEFLTIDFDYSFDNFGIRNATENELTID